MDVPHNGPARPQSTGNLLVLLFNNVTKFSVLQKVELVTYLPASPFPTWDGAQG